MRDKKAILRLVGGVMLAVLVIAGGTLWLYGLSLNYEAQRLLTDVMALKVGTSSIGDAERVLRKHKKLLTTQDCGKDHCYYVFVVENVWLARFHLEPPAQFRAGMSVKNGAVSEIFAELMRSMDIYPTFPASAGAVNEYAEMPEHLASHAHFGFLTPVGKPYLRVVLDGRADAQARQRAFGFSFKCLTKAGGGCDLPCDYLPEAWQDWKSELRSSGLPMSDFDRAYPKNQRCRQF